MTELKAPDSISAEARKHFERLVAEVEHRWESYHADALERYCETCEDLRQTRAQLRKLDDDLFLVKRSDGQQQLTPLLNAVKEHTKLARELGAELGLSPVSEAKSKLEGPPADKSDSLLADMEAVAEAKRRGS